MLARRLRAVVAVAVVWPTSALAQAPTTYTAAWASLDLHNPAPEWFKDAKFGIYFHWGAFGTAAFESEWYPRNMFNTGDPAHNHHLTVYGNPLTTWGYDKFITGANDLSGHFVGRCSCLALSGDKQSASRSPRTLRVCT